MDLQDSYDELDNIVTTLGTLTSEITNEDYKSQLIETMNQAQEELDGIIARLREERKENEKQDIYEYQRGAL